MTETTKPCLLDCRDIYTVPPATHAPGRPNAEAPKAEERRKVPGRWRCHSRGTGLPCPCYHNGYGCPNEHREVQRSAGWSKDERKPAPAPVEKAGLRAEELTDNRIECKHGHLRRKCYVCDLEDDYQLIVGPLIAEAAPAKDREDDQLEPPWDVAARIIRERDVLRAELAQEKAAREKAEARIGELHKAIDTLLGLNDMSQYYFEDALVELEAARQKKESK